MVDANDVVRKALEFLVNPNQYGYCLGAQGERLEELGEKIRYYYKMSTYEYAMKYHYNMDTIMFDCSGLVNYCVGLSRNYTSKDYGLPTRGLSTDLKGGRAGSVLWKKGHVGIDVGHGLVVEIKNEGSRPSISRISDRDFTHTVELPCVDYTYVNNR